MTNLAPIKELVKYWIEYPLETAGKLPPQLAVIHPILESSLIYIREGDEAVPVDVTKQADFDRWAVYEKGLVDKAEDFLDIYLIVRKSMRMTLLKFSKPYLSKREFTKFLKDCWVNSEAPNNDINCSVDEVTKWFRESSPSQLMKKRERDYFDALPEDLVIYRGISKNGKEEALSWTTDFKTARWFAQRFSTDGHTGIVLKTIIKKSESAICYFDDRDEEELICDPSTFKNKIEKQSIWI